jgi:hypothetical protein
VLFSLAIKHQLQLNAKFMKDVSEDIFEIGKKTPVADNKVKYVKQSLMLSSPTILQVSWVGSYV